MAVTGGEKRDPEPAANAPKSSPNPGEPPTPAKEYANSSNVQSKHPLKSASHFPIAHIQAVNAIFERIENFPRVRGTTTGKTV
jgi:hypothetical protein